MTFQEFQIKVMSHVFKEIETNNFTGTLYMLTGKYKRKIAPIPPEMFSDTSVIADNCKNMNKLANSIFCCFVSECNFTKLDREACTDAGIDFDKIESKDLTLEEVSKIKDLTIEGLVFNFESLNDDPKIMMFKKENENYIPSIGFKEEDDSLEQTAGTFSNLLNK